MPITGISPTLGLRLIFAECHPDNIASEKVLVKCGMTKNTGSGGILQYVMEAKSASGIRTFPAEAQVHYENIQANSRGM